MNWLSLLYAATLKPHILYLLYVLRHKWFVLQAGRKLHVSFWQLLVHDLSKFSPAEWYPYVDYFYGGPHPSRQEHSFLWFAAVGFPKSLEEVEEDFNRAWLHHIHASPHHWQYWILREDSGSTILLPMPDTYRREMLADWIGAGKAQGNPDTKEWYRSQRGRIRLHPTTRQWVEVQLGVY